MCIQFRFYSNTEIKKLSVRRNIQNCSIFINSEISHYQNISYVKKYLNISTFLINMRQQAQDIKHNTEFDRR